MAAPSASSFESCFEAGSLLASKTGSNLVSAEVDIRTVHTQKLKALRDDDPPRHVNVVGWPSYVEGKDLVKSIAQELARNASLTLLSVPLSK